MSGHKTNEQIKAKVVHVVVDGNLKRNISKNEALSMAKKANLDLVKVGGEPGEPPVCKLLDYGKMMYDQKKKNKGKAKNNKNILKEVRVGFTISNHDLNIKHRKIKEFLDKGFKVKYVLELKGRHKMLFDDAKDKFEEFLSNFDDANISSINSSRNSLSAVLSY